MADEIKKDDKPAKKTVSVGDVLAKDKAPKPEAKKSADKGAAKKKHKHTHIEHHYDAEGKAAGHTVRHSPMGGGEEVSYAAPDMDAVHDGLEEHVGDENAGEGLSSAQGGGEASAQQQPQQMAQPMPQQAGA